MPAKRQRISPHSLWTRQKFKFVYNIFVQIANITLRLCYNSPTFRPNRRVAVVWLYVAATSQLPLYVESFYCNLISIWMYNLSPLIKFTSLTLTRTVWSTNGFHWKNAARCITYIPWHNFPKLLGSKGESRINLFCLFLEACNLIGFFSLIQEDFPVARRLKYCLHQSMLFLFLELRSDFFPSDHWQENTATSKLLHGDYSH